MIQILVADYLYTPNGYIQNMGVAFNDTIQAVDDLRSLQKQFPKAGIITTKPNTIIYPGFINTHVHLEFSANRTALEYGEFMPWLHSVIEKREALIEACDDAVMTEACRSMLKSGITTFGAVSSYGSDLEVCKQAPQRVCFFNELIGSDPATVDVLYGDFLERLRQSEMADNDAHITPAIAIHSPYSVHPIVLKRAVALAKEKKYPLSAHFLESPEEREWLESNSGGFAQFFNRFFGTDRAVTTIDEFLQQFNNYPTHFIHAVQANQDELKHIGSKGHSIAHCPRSNRYLGCGRLAIEKLRELNIPYTIATDGLSSNNSLNIFDELRAALMLHHQIPLKHLANTLIKSITSDAADILKLNTGRIATGRAADFAIVTLPDAPNSIEEIAIHTILHTHTVDEVYIAGENIAI